MSMMVRKQIDESLRNGTPLPLPEPPRPNTNNDPDKETLAILERARNAKRKNLRQIEASGAYNHSYYRPPTDNKMHGEKAKSQLQFTMAGTHLPDPAVKPRRRPREEKDVTEEDLINERKCMRLWAGFRAAFIRLFPRDSAGPDQRARQLADRNGVVGPRQEVPGGDKRPNRRASPPHPGPGIQDQNEGRWWLPFCGLNVLSFLRIVVLF